MCRHKLLCRNSVPRHASLPALRAAPSSFADICKCALGLTISREVSLPLRGPSLFNGNIPIVHLPNLLCAHCYFFVTLDQNKVKKGDPNLLTTITDMFRHKV